MSEKEFGIWELVKMLGVAVVRALVGETRWERVCARWDGMLRPPIGLDADPVP